MKKRLALLSTNYELNKILQEKNWLMIYANLMPCQIMKEASLLQPLMNWHFLWINLKLTCLISSLPKMNRFIIT